MCDLVFLPEVRNELRQTLAVRIRKKCVILIAFPVVFYQVWKVLLEEWEKDCGGTGLQEKRVCEYVVRARLGGCSYERFQVGRGVCDSGHYWRTAQANPYPSGAQCSNGLQTQIRTWRLRC